MTISGSAAELLTRASSWRRSSFRPGSAIFVPGRLPGTYEPRRYGTWPSRAARRGRAPDWPTGVLLGIGDLAGGYMVARL